jgi:hypothetical protein
MVAYIMRMVGVSLPLMSTSENSRVKASGWRRVSQDRR